MPKKFREEIEKEKREYVKKRRREEEELLVLCIFGVRGSSIYRGWK